MYSHCRLFAILLAAVFAFGALGVSTKRAMSSSANQIIAQDAPVPDGSHDFDFLYGTWLVHNSRLVKTPAGEKWFKFDATDKYGPLPGGLGNEDVYRADQRKKGFVAMTIRLYNPTTDIWKIYYFDNMNSHGDAGIPNVGRFHGNVGIFDEQLTFQGKPAIDRYTWTKLGKDGKVAPHFEESISQDGGKTWKVLFIADLIRAGA